MTSSDSARSHWWNNPAWTRATRAGAAAIPVVLVNAVAFTGQFLYLSQHVPWAVPARVLIAVAIESIAIYLAWHAHLATMSNDSSTRLKLGAYFVALAVGVLNYSHFAAHWRPTVLAGIFGMASVLSPWLWGVHTRRASRDKLLARDLIEEHAVRLGATRWMWHPIRSVRVTYWATWHGVNEPKRAIGHFENRCGTADTPEPVRATVPAPAPVAVPGSEPVPAIGPAAVPGNGGADEAAAEAYLSALENGTVNEAYLRSLDPDAARALYPTAMFPARAVEVEGDAFLEADANLSGSQGVTPETKAAAEMYLMSLDRDAVQAMSYRKIARDLLHDPNQRRLARKLKDQRLAAEPPREEAPAREQIRPVNGAVPQMITPPRGYQPGGING